jgi:hypothetical protein
MEKDLFISVCRLGGYLQRYSNNDHHTLLLYRLQWFEEKAFQHVIGG